MGTCYSIYAEVRVGNKWYNISPLIRELDGQVKAQPFLSGKSMLHETVEQLREYSYKCGRPDDLSDELRTIFGEPDDDIVDPFFHEMTYKEYYRQMMFTVNYGKAVKNRVKKTKPTRYSGYANRYAITEFEIGESDTVCHWITEAEYSKLPEDEKQEYTYYEWDEYGDWYAMFVKLSRMVDTMLDVFCDWGLYNIHDVNLDERTPTADYVRLIVYID